MNLLVSGGLGTIGSDIVRAAGDHPAIQTTTFSRRDQPGNRCHEAGSILDEVRLREVLEQRQITHLVHAAGARTKVCEDDPLLGFETNVLATDRLCRAANAVDSVEQVVLFSTAAVYGQVDTPVDERFPLAASTNYALTKASAEISAIGHARQAKFRLAILRPGFVVGRNSTSKLNAWIQAAAGEPKVKIEFAPRFHLHWSPDLGKAVIALLQAGGEGIFHPPGNSYALEDLACALREVAVEQGRSLDVGVSLDPCLDIPGELDHSRFEEAVGLGSIPTTELRTIVRCLSEGQ